MAGRLFLLGRFIDKHSLSDLLALLFLATTALPLIYFFTYNLWFLGIAQGISGFIAAAIELVGYVVITRMASPPETPRYMAVHTVLGGIRGATAPFIGPVIMDRFGADAAFAIVAAFIVAAFVLLKIINRSTAK